MPLFEYRARNAEGLLIQARLEAPSQRVVAGQLLDLGITPVQITELKPHVDPLAELRRFLKRERVELEDLIAFSRQMYTLARAGVPIMRAITRLSESMRSPLLGRVLGEVADDLRSGRDLSAALQRHSSVFPRLFVSIVQVGENTGRLEEAFRQNADYLELERETRKRIKAATRYPMLVLAAIFGAMVVINVFVIPSFSRTFASLNAELPWATLILIGTSNFTIRFWPLLILGGIGAAFGLRSWRQTDAGRLIWDQWKLRVPIIGSILMRATLARYARSLAMTLSAGLPVIQALGIVARAVDNDWVCQRMLVMRSSIERGEPMSRSAASCGMFTPLVLDMIAVGEESGTLDEMHREIALAYESEVDYDLKRLSDLLEPLLIAGVGVVVLILALGVYLPMWDLATAVKGR